MKPTRNGQAYCSTTCKEHDESSSGVEDNSPVPALISGNASSECSSTPSSRQTSPNQGPSLPDEEPTQLALPPPLHKPLHFNYSYSCVSLSCFLPSRKLTRLQVRS